MKILNRIAATACLFGAVLLVSCESPDLSTAHESQVNGLLNVTIQIPDNPTEFYATKKGPYEEGEEITVKVPTTDEDPLDVSRLICTVSVEHNCYVVPGVGGEMDFTEPYKITVIDALGNRHNNTIRVGKELHRFGTSKPQQYRLGNIRSISGSSGIQWSYLPV